MATGPEHEEIREDFRKGSGTGKTRNVQCTPPNVKCGGRCIPPTWDCRRKGEGADKHTNATKNDPLAGIAGIQRGAKDVAKGTLSLNPARIERGRRSIIRGTVKLTPGSDLQKKRKLQRELTDKSTPIMAVLGLGIVGIAAHRGLNKNFASYRNNVGRPLDRAATNAVGTVLDRLPVIGARRAGVRAGAAGVAGQIGSAGAIGNRINEVNRAASENLRRIGPNSFRPTRSADFEGSNVVSGLREVDKRARAGSLSYDQWRQSSVETLYGATVPRGANGRISIFADEAANQYLSSQFRLNTRAGASLSSQASKNKLVTTELAGKLGVWKESLQADMRQRGFVGDKGVIGKSEIKRYVDEVGVGGLSRGFGGLTKQQRDRLTKEGRGLMTKVLSADNLEGEARSLRNQLVSDYDQYFRTQAGNLGRNAAATDSPFGDAATGLARYVTRNERQVLSRDHGDLMLRYHYHRKVMNQKSDLVVADNTARRIAQTITRSAELPTVERAFQILNKPGNGFVGVGRVTSTPRQRPARLLSEAEIVARLRIEGMSAKAARAEAKRRIEERGDSTERVDFKGGSRLGKPCGESYIPKARQCNKGKGKTNKAAVATAVVAGAAGVAAAAALSNPELRRRARVNGKLLARDSDRVFRGALKLSSRGVVSGLSSKQVKEGLGKLPEAFQQPARQLIGGAKKAAAAMGLKAEGYRIQDIDVANNFSTWKNKSGTLVSIGSYGDSVVTYVSNNSHSWNGKRVYKIGFNVDQEYDAMRDIPRAQASAITSGVKKMTDNHLGKIKDGFLATYPWDGDEYGGKRRSLYRRAGFNDIVGESSQWAQVSGGRIKKMTAAESFVFLAESGERDAPIYKPAKKRKDSLDLKPSTDGNR